MNHRRKPPPYAVPLPLACSLLLLAGCGESGGVSAVPVKGEPSAGGSSMQPSVPPSSPRETRTTSPAKSGGKRPAPLDVVE